MYTNSLTEFRDKFSQRESHTACNSCRYSHASGRSNGSAGPDSKIALVDTDPSKVSTSSLSSSFYRRESIR